MNWTVRVGPVVHRESIPLAQVRELRSNTAGVGDASSPDGIVRLSENAAWFAVPSVPKEQATSLLQRIRAAVRR